MEPDDNADNNHSKGGGSASSALRIKVAELEHKVREEKQRYDLLQFESNQEVEKYSRDCLSLSETVARLEQDCCILRERETRDRERIKGLLEEIVRKDGAFKEKFVDFTNEVLEWKTKYLELKESCRLADVRELEARASKLVEENFRLLEKEKTLPKNSDGKQHAPKVDEGLPKRNAESMQKSCVDDLILTPELARKRAFEGVVTASESDGEDEIQMRRLVTEKGLVKGVDGPAKRSPALGNRSSHCIDIGGKRKPPRKRLFPGRVLGKGTNAAEEGFEERAHTQTLILPANKKGKRSSRCSSSKRKLQVLGSSCSPVGSAGHNHQGNESFRSKKKLKMVGSNCPPPLTSRVCTNHDMVAGSGSQIYSRRNCKHQTGRSHRQTIAFSEQKLCALDKAEKVRSSLNPCHPSFVKSLVRSHVSSCFWLGLPTKFCKENLSENTQIIVLEAENGSEHYTCYIGERIGLSGGWRGFALSHKLEVGDALVFELVGPARFRVYIIKANGKQPNEDLDHENAKEDIGTTCPTGAKALAF